MSLIVENGTGLSTAESYITVAAASTRQSALGNSNWTTLSTAEMEEALRRATQYMLQAYRGRWQGTRINATQALDWPRNWVTVDGYAVDADIVPTDIANACADMAFRAAAGDLAADLTRGIVREQVGPLETEYDRNSPQSVRYRAIDMMLAPYLTRGAGGSMMVVRT